MSEDNVQLLPDVASYTQDYQLEQGRLVLPEDRLLYWKRYFQSIADNDKTETQTHLLAWAIKCMRLIKEQAPEASAEVQWESIKEAVENTTDIVAILMGAERTDLLRSLGNVVVEAGSRHVVVKEGRIESATEAAPGLPTLTADRALDRMQAVASFNFGEMRRNSDQARSESASLFRLTLVSTALGFGVIIVGVVFMWSGFVPAGAVTTAAGIIPEALAAILFNRAKEYRAMVSSYDSRVRESQRFVSALDFAETIEDPQQRSSMKTTIIESMLTSTS